MMNTIQIGEMAKIFLKDGKQKMGLLLNNVESPDAFEDGIKYVPHNKVGEWLETFSIEFIQTLQADSVDGIDLIMK